MSETSQPAIIAFKMQHDEFLFLGKEYPSNSDMSKVWSDFCNGGYEVIKKHRRNSYDCMVINHNNNSEYNVYSPGTIVGTIDEIPEGFTLTRFPAREFLVVTHEWVPTKDEALGQIGRIDEAKHTVEMPNGYERYDGPGCQIILVEIENMNTENGSRWENWVPIKKVEQDT